jgi:hypothetical protein
VGAEALARAAARITRARRLAPKHPQASEPLTFYADLVELQQSLLVDHADAVRPAPSFAESLDPERAADALPGLLKAIAQTAPAALADAARDLLQEGHDRWRHLAHTYWRERGTGNGERGTGDLERGTDDLRAFIAEALLQPFAEAVARRGGLRPSARSGRPEPVEGRPDPPGVATDDVMRCPVCHDRPVVAVLREEAHGAKRSFVCGFCLSEWPAPRIACPACGEGTFDKLAVYRADEFPGARIDACDSCRAYLKTIDLTKDATAVPVVDDIATLSLDVWAREQGYTRLRPNLLRL